MCLEVLVKAQTSCSACIKVVSAVQTTGLKIQFVCSISQISVVVTSLIGVQMDKQVFSTPLELYLCGLTCLVLASTALNRHKTRS